jgi:hypothetical protein
MDKIAPKPQEIRSLTGGALDYSICSLVTKPELYEAMVQSFAAAGFDAESCEYLYADNTRGADADGYQGLNRMIAAARGSYIILAHQDVLALDTKAHLDRVLAELTQAEPAWAVAGNAGCDSAGRLHSRITDKHMYNGHLSSNAVAVLSLDENFILLRRDALIGFSHDLSGYHLYGTDIVQQARLRGRSAFVIDFHLEHLGAGMIDQNFVVCMQAFQDKYKNIARAQQILTPSTRVSLGQPAPSTARCQKKLARRTARTEGPAPLSYTLKRISGGLADGIHRRLLGRPYLIDGHDVELGRNAPLGLRRAVRRGRVLRDECAMVAKHLRADLPVVQLDAGIGLLTPSLRRAIGPDQRILAVAETASPELDLNLGRAGAPERTTLTLAGAALAEIVAQHGFEAGFALISTRANDVLGQLQDGTLSNCRMLLLTLKPLELHAAGRTVGELLKALTHAGFQVLETKGAVLVAARG